MDSKEDIEDRIIHLNLMAKYWYKQNKDPNRGCSRYHCVQNIRECKNEIKILKRVLGEENC